MYVCMYMYICTHAYTRADAALVTHTDAACALQSPASMRTSRWTRFTKRLCVSTPGRFAVYVVMVTTAPVRQCAYVVCIKHKHGSYMETGCACPKQCHDLIEDAGNNSVCMTHYHPSIHMCVCVFLCLMSDKCACIGCRCHISDKLRWILHHTLISMSCLFLCICFCLTA